jgi:hypothetical protein
MLDGVFERRNNFFEIRRQLATTFDVWPQSDRWGENQGAAQRDRITIVVEIWPHTAMKRVARPTHAWPAVFPMTGPADVGAPLVGEKHVCATIDALSVPLQAPRARGQWCEIDIVGYDHQQVDVLRIRLECHDRTQDGNTPHAGNLPDRRNESAEPVEQVLTLTLRGGVHRQLQSGGGTSFSGTNTSIERARPGVRLIKPCRSRVTIML